MIKYEPLDYIILDRDGVINYDNPNYVKSVAEWQSLSSSLHAIALLNKHNINVIVTTNQSGIGRGIYTHDDLTNIHDKMHQELADVKAQVKKVYYCPHTDEDKCNCRKPKTGMIEKVIADYNLSVSRFKPMFVVGDSYRDLVNTKKIGCQPILVRTGNGNKTIKNHSMFLRTERIPIYENLWCFVQDFLKSKFLKS